MKFIKMFENFELDSDLEIESDLDLVEEFSNTDGTLFINNVDNSDISNKYKFDIYIRNIEGSYDKNISKYSSIINVIKEILIKIQSQGKKLKSFFANYSNLNPEMFSYYNSVNGSIKIKNSYIVEFIELLNDIVKYPSSRLKIADFVSIDKIIARKEQKVKRDIVKSKNRDLVLHIKKLPEYVKLISAGVKDTTSDTQLKNGTLSFHYRRLDYVIYKTGYLRRSSRGQIAPFFEINELKNIEDYRETLMILTDYLIKNADLPITGYNLKEKDDQILDLIFNHLNDKYYASFKVKEKNRVRIVLNNKEYFVYKNKISYNISSSWQQNKKINIDISLSSVFTYQLLTNSDKKKIFFDYLDLKLHDLTKKN